MMMMMRSSKNNILNGQCGNSSFYRMILQVVWLLHSTASLKYNEMGNPNSKCRHPIRFPEVCSCCSLKVIRVPL